MLDRTKLDTNNLFRVPQNAFSTSTWPIRIAVAIALWAGFSHFDAHADPGCENSGLPQRVVGLCSTPLFEAYVHCIALIFAFLSTTAVHAEIYNYSCNACLFPKIVIHGNEGYDGCDVVHGKTYPLRVDENKNVLEWRGKKYAISDANTPDKIVCAKAGWHAEGNGTSFHFCAATQGYGAIEDKGDVKVRCNLKRRNYRRICKSCLSDEKTTRYQPSVPGPPLMGPTRSLVTQPP